MNQEILELLAEKKYSAVKQLIGQMEEADLAKLFEELENEEDADQFNRLFRLLPKETAAEVFSYMEPEIQEKIVRTLTDTELQHILDDLFMDDYVDLVEEMPANVVKRVMQNTTPANRKLINQYLKYPEDSAGSLMTNEYVYFRSGITVAKAFEIIREYGIDKETIYTCYVTDNSRHLLGVTTVKELLLHDYDDDISDFMETNVIYINTLDDQEIAAQQLDKYNFLALPVVDMEERLVGIITIDDAMDVMQEENTEDIQKMNAMLPTEKTYLKTTVFETWKSRFPWLLLLMVSATFTGSIISSFEDKLAAMTILTAFIPMLMDTGGNSGGQASVTVIRAMSLGEIEFKNYFKVLWKEIRVGFICGISLAAVNFVKILLIDKMLLGNSEITLIVDLAICLTLVIEIIFAKMIGCTLPMLAKKCGFDPAVMSSPFITTIVDAVSLLIFFGISTAIIPQLH